MSEKSETVQMKALRKYRENETQDQKRVRVEKMLASRNASREAKVRNGEEVSKTPVGGTFIKLAVQSWKVLGDVSFKGKREEYVKDSNVTVRFQGCSITTHELAEKLVPFLRDVRKHFGQKPKGREQVFNV